MAENEGKNGACRRTCLKGMLAFAGGAAVGVGGAKAVGPLWNRDLPRYRNFTGEEARTLIAVCEQFIPRDEFPGAAEAGAADYIDLQISEGRPFENCREAYHQWLAAVNALSLKVHQKPFADLAWDVQTKLLKQIEGAPGTKAFFQQVLTHTNQGYYGSPVHGGSQNYAGYHSVGLDQPRLCGRHRPDEPFPKPRAKTKRNS